MLQFPPRLALMLLGVLALLGAAACAPTATTRTSPTATTPPTPTPTATPTPTPTPALAPTPTNVPTGWLVLVGEHFSLAYPADWEVQGTNSNDGSIIYDLTPPNPHNQGVQVSVYQLPQTVGSEGMAPYCTPLPRVTLAGLRMAYQFGVGEAASTRDWGFVNARRTEYSLDAFDALGTTTAQAQDNRILATFRPDNAQPWKC